jgi:hypothetical protein
MSFLTSIWKTEKEISFPINSHNTIKLVTYYNLMKMFTPDNLLFQSQSGDIQRNIDPSHLDSLINYQKHFYQKHKFYSFPNPFFVAEFEDKYALIDGQHRLDTLKYLYNNFIANETKLLVSIIHLKSIDEYDSYFVAINKNKPVQLYKNINDWKSVGKGIENFFLKNYKRYLKKSEKPRIPHINLNKMKKYLDDNQIISQSGLNLNSFIQEIINLNNFYHTYWMTEIYNKGYIKNMEKKVELCLKKQPENPLYLGIFKDFEWLDRIVYKVKNNFDNYIGMEHISKNHRVKIPKKIRKLVWKKRNSSNLNGTCYVCQEKIEFDNFQCGHIISVFYGGKTNINNMEPICGQCNNDMGIHNLNQYKQSFMEMQ